MRKSIILIVAAAFASGAHAAKLCLPIDGNSYAYNNNAKIWAFGHGCGAFNGGDHEGGNKPSITDPAQLCGGGRRFSGTCESDGNNVWCQVTWPGMSSKFYLGPSSNLANYCAFHCGNAANTNTLTGNDSTDNSTKARAFFGLP
jgi:hypothetical protein